MILRNRRQFRDSLSGRSELDGSQLESSTTACSRCGGFTILEIMIATAILTLGLVGILALFPVAIHSGKQVVEKSTAVVVAESVAEAIRDGIRNQLRFNRKSGDLYFVLKHDGIVDTIPVKIEDESARDDYYVLLPTYKGNRFSGRKGRDKALERASTFLYPETDRNANGGGKASRADDDGNDFTYRFSNGDSYTDVFVEKTYQLGQNLPGQDDSGDNVLDDQKIDAIKQYSFAFTISPSYNDTNLSANSDQYMPGGRLFHVRIMVYRSFYKADRDADQPIPAFELDFEVVI